LRLGVPYTGVARIGDNRDFFCGGLILVGVLTPPRFHRRPENAVAVIAGESIFWI
jgi:hypothetical protein